MENRTEERVHIKIPIEITAPDLLKPLHIVSDNFCPCGAYLSPPIPFKTGDRVICKFSVPGIEISFKYEAKVVHVDGDLKTNFATDGGFGVEFINTTAFDQTTIRRALWDFAG